MRTIFDNFRVAHEREEIATIHETVERGVDFKGTNLWILIFAIFIASIGLNVNSTAIIIGAMLISPLMGPITGMGYSLATYDFSLFRRSLLNFSFASVTALVTSALYFLITPLNEAHSELLARTSPNIYDVLIALLGGLAGVIAISSRKKGNVIPGVAIATALMPPLCTAGYGLGTLQWNFFGGAIYLFTINVVFIGLATMITTRFLRIPVLGQIDERHKTIANRSVMVIVMLTLIPSVYFGYLMVLKDHFIRTAKSFVRNETYVEGDYLLNSEVDFGKKEINLIYGGRPITEEDKKKIAARIRNYGLEDAKVSIVQAFSVEDLSKSPMAQGAASAEITRLQTELALAQQRYDSIAGTAIESRKILAELQVFYPELTGCAVSVPQLAAADTSAPSKVLLLVVLYCKAGALKPADQEKITQWLAIRYPEARVETHIKEEP